MRDGMLLNEYPMIDDIKNEYIMLRESGKSRTETVESLVLTYNDELTMGHCDDALIFWIGVAEVQSKTKELSEDVAEKALAALNIIEKQHIFSQTEINRCRKKYSQISMTERKFTKRKKYECTWDLGDTYAVKLTNDVAKELGMFGMYAVLQKIDSVDFGDGRILPLVYITVWDDLPNPMTEDIFYSKRPIKLRPMFDNKPKFQYRAQILFTSKKQIKPEVFTYIGNYPVKLMSDELTPEIVGAIVMLSPKTIDDDCCYLYRYSLELEKRYSARDGLNKT